MDAPHPAIAPAAGSRPSMADAWAGLAAMLVAVPSALAFGVAVHVAVDPSLAAAGAMAGLLGAAVLGIIAPLVGGNLGFITAPCAPAAAVLAGLAVTLARQEGMTPERVLSLVALTALLSALLQVAFGLLRAGRLIKYIPYQVVTGYLSGVALIIATSQLPRLVGAPAGTSLVAAVTTPSLWAWQAVLIGVAAIAAMVAGRHFVHRVPGPLLALASGLLVYMLLAAFDARLSTVQGNGFVVGPIDTSASLVDAAALRADGLFAIAADDVVLVLASAATLAVLLSMDTLKTGVVLDAMLRRRHDSNRELFAQGVANLASFGLGGMAGAGTMGASLVNVTSGARSHWSSVAAGVFALAALVALSAWLAWLPLAALAGILLVVAWRMFDFSLFRLLRQPETRLDFAIIATVIVAAQWFGLIQAALAGVGLAILLFLRDQAGTSVVLRKRDLSLMRSKRKRPQAEVALLQQQGAHALVVELKGNLFFGTTDQLLGELDAELARRRYVLLDLRRVASMDYTAAHLFDQIRHRLQERGGALLLCGMPSRRSSRQDIQSYCERVGLRQGGGLGIFDTRDAALEWMEARLLESAGWQCGDDEGPLALSHLPPLRGFTVEEIAQVEAAVQVRELKAGEVLFRRGDMGDELFFVRCGIVHIRLPLEGGKHHHLATFGRGELFGELSFLDRMPRSADAVAAGDASVFALPREAFEQLQRQHPHLAATLFERIAQVIGLRLRLADAELRELEER